MDNKGNDPEEIKRKMGDRLRVLRRAAGLTQEGLAERTDIDASFITKLEAGERLPSVETVVRLAGGLGVPVSRIMEALDEAPRPADGRMVDEVVDILRSCTPHQLQHVKRFIELVILDTDRDETRT